MEVDLQIPRQVLVAISQKLTQELTLVANADWEQWGRFGGIDLLVASPAPRTLSAEIDSRDTWHIGVGLRWRPRPKWLLTTGLS